jgi:DNA repair protein RadC
MLNNNFLSVVSSCCAEHAQHELTLFHPSGDPTPSPEDIAVTQQLVAAGQHLDIELVDHLVIGNQRFVSLKERLRW